MNRALALLQKAVDVRPNEVRALGLGFAFHFLILTGYYILRPIRDSIAASNRLETLPWMFTATLVAMLLANVLFAAVVARMSRRKFIPLAYGFFIFNLGLFFVLMRSSPSEEQVWIGRGLYVWVSVFNLFNTAIFWAFMTDLFTVEQGKRLYGFIAVGGSLGAIAGAYITKHYVGQIGPANLLAISAVMFAVAGSLVRFFPTGFADRHEPDEAKEAPIGGSVWSGLTHIARSPYLLGLAGSMLLYTITSTWAYFQQSDLAREALKGGADRYDLPRQPRDLGQQHHGPDSDFSYRSVAEVVWGWNHARGDAVPEHGRLCGDGDCAEPGITCDLPSHAAGCRLCAVATFARNLVHRPAA